MSGTVDEILRNMRRVFGLLIPDGPGKARTFPDPTTPRPAPPPSAPALYRRPSHQAGYSWRKWEPIAEPGDPPISIAPFEVAPVPAERLRRYVG